jgi:hypothetical protein
LPALAYAARHDPAKAGPLGRHLQAGVLGKRLRRLNLPASGETTTTKSLIAELQVKQELKNFPAAPHPELYAICLILDRSCYYQFSTKSTAVNADYRAI